ncbi:HAD hydrolase family protein [Corynebacterium kozikiae]|uniref:HAD hydrolase family protein n=1 Tax=Corynebacterium kozikiae TaxID=2968469 RepID=UPI00211BF0CB|nr:HAD family hydrolase [Corynebacterium sp. 76QC2CO]MCQ9343391.1 Cof-type HAD-IIB family hydrolase [Corynebacterium sp. 76QC2CO]
MKKLASIDLDGTLFFNRQLALGTKEALQEWRRRGNIAVCNTGKSIEATKLAIEHEALPFDYYVLYTGAVVADKDFSPIIADTIPTSVVREVLGEFGARKGVAVFATTLDSPDVQLANNISSEGATDLILDFVPLDVADLDKHQFVGIPLWVDLPEPEFVQVEQWLRENVGCAVEVHRNQNFLDLVPHGANKGTGLTHLRELVEQELGETVEVHTLGDSWNDLDMHKVADVSVSFPHAPAEVQQAVDVVTESAVEYLRTQG